MNNIIVSTKNNDYNKSFFYTLPKHLKIYIIGFIRGFCILRGPVFTELKLLFLDIINEFSGSDLLLITDILTWVKSPLRRRPCQGYTNLKSQQSCVITWHQRYATINFIKWYKKKDLIKSKLAMKSLLSQYTNLNIIIENNNTNLNIIENNKLIKTPCCYGGNISIIITI